MSARSLQTSYGRGSVSAGLRSDTWWGHRGDDATLEIVGFNTGVWSYTQLALPDMTRIIRRHFPGVDVPVDHADR